MLNWLSGHVERFPLGGRICRISGRNGSNGARQPLTKLSAPFTGKALPARPAFLILVGMRRPRRRALAGWLIYVLLMATPLLSATQVWKKIRYQGGTIEANVNPFDWNTTLTASSGHIELVFAGRKTVSVAAGDITALSYGQKAYRHVADMAALSVIATPIALFGILHKSTDHLVGIEFRTSAGRGAVLLMVDKSGYRDLLTTLKTITGKPVDNWP